MKALRFVLLVTDATNAQDVQCVKSCKEPASLSMRQCWGTLREQASFVWQGYIYAVPNSPPGRSRRKRTKVTGYIKAATAQLLLLSCCCSASLQPFPMYKRGRTHCGRHTVLLITQTGYMSLQVRECPRMVRSVLPFALCAHNSGMCGRVTQYVNSVLPAKDALASYLTSFNETLQWLPQKHACQPACLN